MKMRYGRTVAVLVTGAMVLAACGGGDDAGGEAERAPAGQSSDGATPSDGSGGVRVVKPQDAAATIAESPDDLVILDIRRPEEFEAGHIEGAVLLDFYRDDFRSELATLDRDTPYVLYCRSGNRSARARAIMADLGFSDVQDVDDGIVGWVDAGLPIVTTS